MLFTKKGEITKLLLAIILLAIAVVVGLTLFFIFYGSADFAIGFLEGG